MGRDFGGSQPIAVSAEVSCVFAKHLGEKLHLHRCELEPTQDVALIQNRLSRVGVRDKDGGHEVADDGGVPVGVDEVGEDAAVIVAEGLTQLFGLFGKLLGQFTDFVAICLAEILCDGFDARDAERLDLHFLLKLDSLDALDEDVPSSVFQRIGEQDASGGKDAIDGRGTEVVLLISFTEVGHAEAPVPLEDGLDHESIARLEDVQRQMRPREEDGVG